MRALVLREIDYSLSRLGGNEPVDDVAAHVLARAYGEAWYVFYRCEPVGQHVIHGLELAIDFGPCGSRRN
jgi:hypothetical protein